MRQLPAPLANTGWPSLKSRRLVPHMHSSSPSFSVLGCALFLGASLASSALAADAPIWLPSTNHWAGNTGGKGGVTGDPISNFVVDLAVLNAADLTAEFAPFAPLVVTKSYWDETNWSDGVYSAGRRISKGEYFNRAITFDSSTYNGITAAIAHPHVLDSNHSVSDPTLTPQQRIDMAQQNAEDQGGSLAAYPDNRPYVSLSGGRAITSVDYPTSVAFDRSGFLWVADNGPDQNFKIFTVGATGAPVLTATFGETGGVFAGPIKGLAGPKRFWGPRGVGFGDHGEIIVGTSGIPGQIQGGTDIRWFESTDRSSLAQTLATATLKHQALATFLHAADFDPTSNGTVLHTESVRYTMDYAMPPGQSWAFAAVTLDPFRFPDDPRLFNAFGTAYVRIVNGKKFLFCTDMVGGFVAVFRFEAGSEIAIPAAFYYLYNNGQGTAWARGQYPTWDPALGANFSRRYRWRDDNGDGQVDAGEFAEFRVASPFSETVDVDADGNIWMGGGLSEYSATYQAGGNWVIPFGGIDAHGVPLQSLAAIERLGVPQSVLLPEDYEISRGPTRLRYLADTDTLLLGVGKGVGSTWYTHHIYVIDGYRRSGHPTRRCIIDLGYDDNGQSRIDLDQNTATMVLPFSFAADNDYVYVGYLDNGRNAKIRGEVTIYSTRDGHQVGWLRADAGTNYFCGAIDLVVGLQVQTLADGSRVICEEEDGGGKVMVFHWNPKDAGPAVQLKAVTTSSAQAKLVFGPTVSNRTYRVLAATDLASGSWTAVSGRLTGTGGDLEFIDTAATGARKFYRLEIVTPTPPSP